MSTISKHVNIFHWLLVGLTIFIFIASAGQLMTTQRIGSPAFLALWFIKVVVASLALAVPLMIGSRQKPFRHSQWTVICLWLIGGLSLLCSRFATPPLTVKMVGILKSPEQYVIQNVFIAWFMSTLLLLGHDQLQKILHRWSSKQRGRVLAAVVALHCLCTWIFHYDLFGFNAATSGTWFLLLFMLGDLIANLDLSRWQLSTKAWAFICLILWLATALAAWLKMNVIQYDPHNDFTKNLHYLYAIPPYQPIMLLTVLATALLFKQIHHSKVDQQHLVRLILLLNLLALPGLINKFLLPTWSWLAAIVIAIVTLAVVALLPVLIQRYARDWSWSFNKTAWQRRFKQVVAYWPVLTTWLILWLITAFSFALLWGNKRWTMVQWMVSKRDPIILVNVWIVFALVVILMAILNRWWLSSGIVIVLYLAWLVASVLKIQARNEPILPSDLSAMAAPKEMLGMVNPWVMGLALAVIVAILLVFIFIDCRVHSPRLRPLYRVVLAACACIYLGGFAWANHSQSLTFRYLQSISDTPYFYSQLRGARMNGTVLQFANNVDVVAMKRPSGYSAAAMHRIQRHYQQVAQQINQHRRFNDVSSQNLVFVLSESYADPRLLPNLKMTGGNPMEFYDQLAQHEQSGLMLSSGYGGGTANMEYQSLTGFSMANFSPTMPTPYSQLVPYQQHPFAINQLFNSSVAVHPFSANLYDRKTVFRKFGFQRFYHLDGGSRLTYKRHIDQSPRISDDSAYKETTLHLKGCHGRFIQLSTMQNHMPYQPAYYKQVKYHVNAPWIKSPEEANTIAAYAEGLHYTDTALKSWIAKLDQMKEPVTVVWYGDHLPGIYSGLSMGQNGVKMHETNYFIYQNPAAKKADSGAEQMPHKVVSPNEFPALAFNIMNVKVSPYLALLTQEAQEMPAMSTPINGTARNNAAHRGGIAFVNAEGKQTKLTKAQKHLLHDYQLVQYDLTAGHHYLQKAAFLTRVPQ
ncbi:LTA synthase family protein [Limosilactobacillus secaliphilus]|uniref:LTA synthase family protein n=1 Tax=Limosilactobacillus secaliphilus TaxID=396268 RepID=UPI000A62E404|nr:LTA synthase family protein [Limosilactobacillus secaliphilus]